MNICLLVFIPIKLTTMAPFAAAAGLCVFFSGFGLFARRFAVSHPPASTVRGAPTGFVSISGTATGPHTLNAPVSGKPCYLSETAVWQRSGRGKSGPWEKVAEETLYLPFFIEDSTGQLLVEPLGANLDLPVDFGAEYGTDLSFPIPDDVPARVRIFLARHSVTLVGPFRIEERIIAPQKPISIAGTLKENPGIRVRPFLQWTEDSRPANLRPATAARPAKAASAPEIIRLSSGPGPASTTEMTPQGKIAAALARAGITNGEARTAAGLPSTESACSGSNQPRLSGAPSRDVPTQSATLEVSPQPAYVPALDALAITNGDDQQATTDSSASFDPIPPLIVMQGEDNPTFVISRHSRQELAGGLGWRPVSMVVGGAALVTFGLYVLLQGHIR